ncbi:MAG: hypothetical protein GX184_04995 [Clostridiaceae bacterium]|nr:hypothetical protein [Clostridiaceae bacterium]
MRFVRFLLLSVFIIAISAITSERSIAKTTMRSESINIKNTYADNPDVSKYTAQKTDKNYLVIITPKINCDPKISIPGDSLIDPKFAVKELP